jgi:hypothetical protein
VLIPAFDRLSGIGGETVKTLKLITILALLLTIHNQSRQSFGQSSSAVAISCQIHLDDTHNFSFSNLSVSVHYQLDPHGRWIAGKSMTPDENGRFITSVPKGSRVLIEVATADPTVRQSLSVSEGNFYTLSENGRASVARIEFAIATNSRNYTVPTIELQRGAAFHPNIPLSVREGGVYFRKSVAGENDETNVVWFWVGSSIHTDIIGGLEAGSWVVKSYDERNSLLYKRTLALQRGRIVSTSR